jgi:hypothetical protein
MKILNSLPACVKLDAGLKEGGFLPAGKYTAVPDVERPVLDYCESTAAWRFHIK